MGKKIKLTEEQLKNIVHVIKEQEFDDAITKFKDNNENNISMSKNDAQLLLNLSLNWCEGKDNHPDYKEVLSIRSKYNLFDN